MSHFTYDEKDEVNKEVLNQGDVLEKSEALVKIIEDVHPYFLNESYTHFLVLTQSCDLVRRGGKSCKAKYITISAVRSLESILERESVAYRKSLVEKKTGFIDINSKSRLEEFLKRLLNNNNPEFFYLHKDANYNFHRPSVATLRVSIALKASLHYDLCCSSKVLELKENFRAKLGWLVGNLYSRVGTEDWTPSNYTTKEFSNLIKEILDSNFVFLDKVNEISKTLLNTKSEEEIQLMKHENLLFEIKKIKVPSKKEIVINRLEEILNASNNIPDEGNIKKLILEFRNDPKISSLLK